MRRRSTSAVAVLRQAALAMPGAELARLAHELAAEAARSGLVHRDDVGTVRAVPLQLLPQLVTAAQRRRLHRIAVQLGSGLQRLAALRRADPRVRAVLPLEAGESDWLDRLRPRLAARHVTTLARLDGRVDLEREDWQAGLRFYETNGVSVGGVNDAVVSDELMLRVVLPRLGAGDAGRGLGPLADLRAIVLERLVAHAHAIGRPHPRVALVQEQPDEDFEALVEYFVAHGVPAVLAHPRELEVRRGNIRVGDIAIDVVYRDLELRDLAALAARGDDLRGIIHAFRRNQVVPSVTGDLDHKSSFEVFTTPALAPHFAAPERAVFARHVLWTRLIRETRTTGPDPSAGADIDLVPFLRASRTQLVLKPNRRWGGAGIVLGPLVTESTWDAALAQAVAEPGGWVAQVWAPPPLAEFPVVSVDGPRPNGGRLERHHVVLGFVATPTALGIYGRASAEPVVNIARRGSLVSVLSGVDLRRTARARVG